MQKIGFIGCGQMGGALAAAAAKTVGGENIWIAGSTSAKTAARAEELGVAASDAESIARTCRLIFIGVKPPVVPEIVESLRPVLAERTEPFVLVSMAAGISIADIQNGTSVPVIRIMPNTPVSVGEGVIAYSVSPEVTEEDEALFLQSMKQAGIADKLPEKLMDAAGAVSGCGPAFVYLFLEALADGAVACGMPRAKAEAYARQTVLGAARLSQESGRHTAQLKDAVCSPGGTTIEGVRTLEKEGFRAAAMDAVIAAYEKTGRLKK